MDEREYATADRKRSSAWRGESPGPSSAGGAKSGRTQIDRGAATVTVRHHPLREPTMTFSEPGPRTRPGSTPRSTDGSTGFSKRS